MATTRSASTIAAATMMLIALAVTTVLFWPREANAQSSPACTGANQACVSQWIDHWFQDLQVSFDSEDMVVTRSYNLPGAEAKYARDGSDYVKLKSITAQHRVRSDDGTDRWWHIADDDQNSDDGVLERGNHSIMETYSDPGTQGTLMTRFQVEVEYQRDSSDPQTARYTIYASPDNVRYEDTRCLMGTPATGYIKISYMRSEQDGGRHTKYMLPGNNNPKRCAGHDWATQGVAYQAQICKANLCTFPDLIGSALGRSDFRGTKEFDRGIKELERALRSNTRAYSVIDRDGRTTGQTTFEAWIWPYISDDFDDVDEYVMFQTCKGFACDGVRIIRGRDIGNYVRD